MSYENIKKKCSILKFFFNSMLTVFIVDKHVNHRHAMDRFKIKVEMYTYKASPKQADRFCFTNLEILDFAEIHSV